MHWVSARRICADVANLPFDVAKREAGQVADLLSWPKDSIEAHTVKSDGPGNVLAVVSLIFAAGITQLLGPVG